MKSTRFFIITVLLSLLTSCKNNKIDQRVLNSDKVEIISYRSFHECGEHGALENEVPNAPIIECELERITVAENKVDELNDILFTHAITDEKCKMNMCESSFHQVVYYKNEKEVVSVWIDFECRGSSGLNIGCLTEKRVYEIETFFKTLGIKYGLEEKCD